MVMTEHGCTESNVDVKLTRFAVNVELSPTSKIVLHFNKLTQLQKQQPFTWMKTPCSKIRWSEVGMYSTNKNDVYYSRFKDNLLVRLVYNSRGLLLKNVWRMIDFCLKEPWIMTIGEHVFKYDVEIYPYIKISKFLPAGMLIENAWFTIDLDTIFYISKGTQIQYRRDNGPTELTKLNFCDVVS